MLEEKVVLEFLEVTPDPHEDKIRYAFGAPAYRGVTPDTITLSIRVKPSAMRKPGDADKTHREAYAAAYEAYKIWCEYLDQEHAREQSQPAPLGLSIVSGQMLDLVRSATGYRTSDAIVRSNMDSLARNLALALTTNATKPVAWTHVASIAQRISEVCVPKDPNQAELPL